MLESGDISSLSGLHLPRVVFAETELRLTLLALPRVWVRNCRVLSQGRRKESAVERQSLGV